MASGYRVSPGRRRPASLILALVAHVLIILALFWAAPKPPPPREVDPDPKTFSLYPAPNDVTRPSPAKVASFAAKTASAAPARPRSPAPATVPMPPRPVPVPSPMPMTMLPGGMELFDAGDIGKLTSRDEETDERDDSKTMAVYGPGEGPGGERMYDAQLLSLPTWSQIVTYLPDRKVQAGYAIIGCRVGDNNSLENCRQLAESPPGSGFARALRLAAWQFRILPPRIGKRRLGYWVRVKITVSELGPQ
jgi:protein TonB